MKIKSALLILIALVLSAGVAHAQFIEDALRYSIPNGIFTPRVGGLNVAYHGIADDAGAMIFNPAGLSLVTKSEISTGLGFTRNNTETKFLDNFNDLSTNNEFISHAALVAPIKTGSERASVGIGYFRESDFDNNMKYSGFNENNTYIAYAAAHGPNDFEQNWTTQTFLANSKFNTPVQDSLDQYSFIQESGGLHNFVGAAAFDLNQNISVGFAFIGKWGSYDYTREYKETDILNIYDYYDEPDYDNDYYGYSNLDFHQLVMNENVNQSISGITGRVGLQGRFLDFFRFGVSVQFPTWFEVDENWSQDATAEYDNPDKTGQSKYNYSDKGRSSYNIRTPFVYSGGISLHAMGATFAAGVEYTDASQLEFSDGPPQLDRLNLSIVQQLVGQVTWGFGAEYNIPLVPIVARASYARTTSPYADDIGNANKSYFSMGAGLYIGKSVRLDALMRWTDVSELRTNYGSFTDGSQYIFTKKPLNIALGFTYRY